MLLVDSLASLDLHCSSLELCVAHYNGHAFGSYYGSYCFKFVWMWCLYHDSIYSIQSNLYLSLLHYVWKISLLIFLNLKQLSLISNV